ncbi:MAG TPA: sigma-70 family RNA polymerase sigma factor [Cyclobacteriaceae bacterium]|nr:sigma-70 family RNA polymerase sigma factor [Cyclobacteriaceae bacterium]MCB9236879.1 sigma-70 family RNA polymerase sigma factor [Flammeovirgaceae bacterium]MCB0498554.1 sigma-70 family RNA polymerase sigma factor [Cyclobacteriaceae bacterium]MCO5271518.1 sigma-70 family RNA polymerase sigma factor [Cyclobacteriaceae bacterium]MCW5901414.1 sigma-70 family RNA polymerase sigma factor [Cyclobacteriaceae bacterium]
MGFQIYSAKESDWIEGCKRQDARAQESVYAHLSGRMYALCCRYVPSKMEAEDVLVMAFAKVFEKIDQFKAEGSFEGWVRKIVVNESLSYLRKNKSMYVETEIETVDKRPDFRLLENHLEADDLLKMVGDLPAGYRMVFNLYAIDGYSHKEIAEQLGISENTSKSQLSRARAWLQKKLTVLEKEAGTKKSNGYE